MYAVKAFYAEWVKAYWSGECLSACELPVSDAFLTQLPVMRLQSIGWSYRAGGTGPVANFLAKLQFFVSTRHISGPQNFRSLLLEGF